MTAHPGAGLLARQNVLDLAPQCLAASEDVDGRLVLVRPRPAAGPGRWRRWTTYLLGARRIRLDDVGSAAWRLFDGRRTVAEVAGALRERFGERAEPVEQRLGLLVRTLHREGLVAYAGWDAAARPGRG